MRPRGKLDVEAEAVESMRVNWTRQVRYLGERWPDGINVNVNEKSRRSKRLETVSREKAEAEEGEETGQGAEGFGR